MYSPTFLHTGNVFTYRVHFIHRNVASVTTVVCTGRVKETVPYQYYIFI